MAIDIFISYSREDYPRIHDYYTKLKNGGFNPWIDKENISSGEEWEKSITEALTQSDVVIVFLSKNTERVDRFFQKEKLLIHDLIKKGDKFRLIIPAFLENCPIPPEFERYNAVDLNGEGGWDKLLSDIISCSMKLKSPTRKSHLAIGRSTLQLPCFFPSISSVAKTTLSVKDHLQFLININEPHFLASAYDLYELTKNGKTEVLEIIKEAEKKGAVVLLDSGNYEKYWLSLKFKKEGMRPAGKTLWNVKKLIEILHKAPFHIAFSFDNLNPSEEITEIIPEIELSCTRCQNRAPQLTTIIPIIHANKKEDLPPLCKEIATRLQPILIAVPERELGEGIYQRAKMINEIRKSLNETGNYIPIHILGTGNPISLLVFSACGADSFDGLEWCQTSVDHETGYLYHSSLADLFLHQTPYGNTELGYAAKTLIHNLIFYKKWMAIIQKSIKDNTLNVLLKEHLPFHALDEIKKIIPEGL